MSNLLALLGNSADALGVINQMLTVTQNNVANASTPGFAKQSLPLEAMPLDLASGAMGGVRAGDIQTARNQYAEQAVRRQAVALGEADENVSKLTDLQTLFDVSGNSGIPYALNNLFQSFSAWAQSPTDTVARQNMLDRATRLAGSFNQAATNLIGSARDSEKESQQTVATVNQLVGQLQKDNSAILNGSKNDPALDAHLNSTLEELSQYVDFTAVQQDDGTVSVLLNGQTALLVSDKQYQLSYKPASADPASPYPTARPLAQITASDGTDITGATTGGQLGALLNFRNEVLASFIGSPTQAGDLNVMAKQFADRVNQLLTPVDTSSETPTPTGTAIFSYDTTNDANVAQTLTVSPLVTPSQLTAINPGPPSVANGVPLALSMLANPINPADEIAGDSFSAYYGAMAARVGSQLNDATNQQQVQQSAVAQARQLRQQVSGVSLDEEAANLIQFQRAYEANSKVISILDQITQDAINILK